jgi:hypothetical protein
MLVGGIGKTGGSPIDGFVVYQNICGERTLRLPSGKLVAALQNK